MRSEIGLLLRLLGPLIQVLCMVLLLGTSAPRHELAGVPVVHLLYGGFVAGFGLVVVGVALSGRRKPPREYRDRDEREEISRE